MPAPSIWLSTLGCAKNQVDSEKIVAMISEAGYGGADRPEAADVVMVNTCAFIEEARAESGTAAAGMDDQVPPDVMMERLRHLSSLPEEVTEARNAEWLGRVDRVLVDQIEGWVPAGRSHRHAPEIDGVIRLDLGRVGEWATVEFTGVYGPDLEATVLRPNPGLTAQDPEPK